MPKRRKLPASGSTRCATKVWRTDVLTVAWQEVHRNGGGAGVDGETVADIESYGVERWLGDLARDLKEGTYRTNAVRQVLIPKKQRTPQGAPISPLLSNLYMRRFILGW